ncbi:MAG TPA: hypothetical protein VFF77_07925 [Holophagaceae bacterium]|jgi:hypothetical protein|nr:hypothetical protein [Holophagaceae bacterium]
MFKKPVWTFELIRDTDAPFERVLEALLDGARYGAWHPGYRSAAPFLSSRAEDRAEVVVEGSPFPGVSELTHFQIRKQEGRTLLLSAARFKGWPVPLLLGWWRLERRDLWERFVRVL